MNIFLSWSGDTSQQIARELKEWLPLILQNTHVFLSPVDIEKGAKWGSEITAQLETTDFGIVCLTRRSLASQWIAFEAGALSKAATGRVATLLFGLTPSEINQPLAQFQTTEFNESDVQLLLNTINKNTPEKERRSEAQIEKLFSRMWPELKEKISLSLVSDMQDNAEEIRPDPLIRSNELLNEIVTLVREQHATIISLEKKLAATGDTTFIDLRTLSRAMSAIERAGSISKNISANVASKILMGDAEISEDLESVSPQS